MKWAFETLKLTTFAGKIPAMIDYIKTPLL